MNELTRLDTINIDSLKEDCELLIKRMENVAICIDMPTVNDSLSHNIKEFVKEYLKIIDDARNVFLQPFEEMVKPIMDLIKPVSLGQKEFAAKILETKKLAFKEKVREEYDYIISASDDGIVIPFDELYDPTWYACANKKEWRDKLLKKYRKMVDDRYGIKKEYEIKVHITYNQLRELETLLFTNGYEYLIK